MATDGRPVHLVYAPPKATVRRTACGRNAGHLKTTRYRARVTCRHCQTVRDSFQEGAWARQWYHYEPPESGGAEPGDSITRGRNPPSPMILKRRVPARTEVPVARWCTPNYCKMGTGWRIGRLGLEDALDRCWWCHHVFRDGEMIALAAFEHRGNRILCQKCARELTHGKQ